MDLSEASVVAALPRGHRPTTPVNSFRRPLGPTPAVVAGLAIVAVITGSLLFDSNGAIWVGQGTWLVGELIPGVVTFAVVGIVILRNPRSGVVGRLMLATALCWGVSALCAGIFIQVFSTGFPFVAELRIASALLSSVGLFIAVFVLPQAFPDGWLTGWFWRLLLILTAVVFAVLQVHYILLDIASAHPRAPVLATVEATDRLAVVQYVGAIAAVLLVLAERVRRGPRLVRQQIAPLAVVWIVSLGFEEIRLTEFGDLRSRWAFVAVWLWPVVVAIVIGYGVLQHQLWETRVVVRRFVVYAAVVGLLTLVFAGVYVAVLLASSSSAVGDEYRWPALVLAAVAVIAADPFRRHLQTALERRLLGERGEPLKPLARLDALTSGSADEPLVYRAITETVAEAVRAPGAALALHRAPAIEVVASSGVVVDPVVLPLLHRGERLGELRVATRTPGEAYGRSDQALLDRLAGQIAALVYGLRRDSDLTTLRSEAIEALIDQRSALGRDLHDGLAPLLAGAGLTAEGLRRGMPPTSPDAQEAARLAARLRAAASEVRRISHDLQPGAERSRLSAVITDYVASVDAPDGPVLTLQLADGADARLSATAELGLSRVALEAITNAIRHAGAEHVVIVLAADADQVLLSVADDGVGIAQPYVSGLGITSMRSRVQALGGTFELVPGPDGGTVLTARVPVSR